MGFFTNVADSKTDIAGKQGSFCACAGTHQGELVALSVHPSARKNGKLWFCIEWQCLESDNELMELEKVYTYLCDLNNAAGASAAKQFFSTLMDVGVDQDLGKAERLAREEQIAEQMEGYIADGTLVGMIFTIVTTIKPVPEDKRTPNGPEVYTRYFWTLDADASAEAK